MTGCLAERYPKEIRSDLVEVDAILGTNQIEEIVRAVSGEPVAPPNSYGRSDADLYLYDDATPRTLIGPPIHRIYEDVRRVRSHVFVLRHPQNPRTASKPKHSIARPGSDTAWHPRESRRSL